MAEQPSGETHRLGTLVTEYTPKRSAVTANKITGILVTAAGVIITVGGSIMGLRDTRLLCLLAPRIIAVVLGVWSYNMWLNQRDMRVLVFSEGLEYTRRGKIEVFRWDEIESVWARIRNRSLSTR